MIKLQFLLNDNSTVCRYVVSASPFIANVVTFVKFLTRKI